MSKIVYLDCPTGIAGDMCLGAIVDAGVPLTYLVENLNKLGISEEYQLWAESVHRNGQRATKLHVDLTADAGMDQGQETIVSSHSNYSDTHYHHGSYHGHSQAHSHTHSHHSSTSTSPRHLPEIEQLIHSAHLSPRATAWSLAVFRRLAEAEGSVHGIPPEEVHFHEVGATDAIVDIVGTCLGLDWLGIDQIYCSALPTGGGTVRAAHGRLPVPVPAVLKLWELRQVPLYSNGIDRELVTPTGAAIVTTLATQFGPPPAMTLLRTGLGAGSLELSLPNILRLWIGERGETGVEIGATSAIASPAPASGLSSKLSSELSTGGGSSASTQTIALLETQIDDLNPQAIGYVFEALLKLGALDVFTQAISMKKSRPGMLLTVVCQPEDVAACEAVIFRETTTLGIRRTTQQRQVLQRQIQTVQTEYGTVGIKVAWAAADRSPLTVQPEYEDCAAIAREQNLPWREVHRLALQSWYAQAIVAPATDPASGRSPWPAAAPCP